MSSCEKYFSLQITAAFATLPTECIYMHLQCLPTDGR